MTDVSWMLDREQAEVIETLAGVATSLSQSLAFMEQALRGLLKEQQTDGKLLYLVRDGGDNG